MGALISQEVVSLTGVGKEILIGCLGIHNTETKLVVASRAATISCALDQSFPDVVVGAFRKVTPNKSGNAGDMRGSHGSSTPSCVSSRNCRRDTDSGTSDFDLVVPLRETGLVVAAICRSNTHDLGVGGGVTVTGGGLQVWKSIAIVE